MARRSGRTGVLRCLVGLRVWGRFVTLGVGGPAGRGVLGAALALAGLWPAPAGAYTYGNGWGAPEWPAGETMYVTLVDSEGWQFGERENWVSDLGELRRVLQQALDMWAAIPTADIRWEMGETISQAVWDALPFEDRPLISVRASDQVDGAARGSRKEDGTWRLRNCRVEFVERRPEWLFRFAVHEFGHCLGSNHPEPYIIQHLGHNSLDYPIFWRHDPLMSYGRIAPGYEGRLTKDDEIMASLTRPAAGWLETTGTILARVTLPDGSEVPYAYVLATRLVEPASASYAVGRLTSWLEHDPPGVADIRGLPPGDYWLLVRSPTGLGTATRLNFPEFGVVLDLRQTVRAGPVRVVAGEEVRVSLPVRRVGRLP